MNKIKYTDYEKISDDLCYMGPYATLKFNVTLGHKDKKGFRVPFHSEVCYPSNKYGRRMNLINIKRHFSFFLSIETISFNLGFREYIYINPRDILDLRMKLNQVFAWFSDKKYDNLYALDKRNNLIIIGKVEPVKIIRLAMDKYLEFEPIVYKTESIKSMGVRIYLSSNSNYIDLSVDNFSEFKYFVDSINMYEAALSLLSYIERPPFGTNLYTVQDDGKLKTPNESDINKTNNKPAPRKLIINQSITDKINSL